MNTQKTEPLKTVLVISVGLTLVYLLTKWNWAIYASLIIGLSGTFSSFLRKNIDWLWMKLSWLLSLIIPNIILAAVFYFLLFPLSVLSKLFGKNDPLNLNNSSESNYLDKNKDFTKASFENLW